MAKSLLKYVCAAPHLRANPMDDKVGYICRNLPFSQFPDYPEMYPLCSEQAAVTSTVP